MADIERATGLDPGRGVLLHSDRGVHAVEDPEQPDASWVEAHVDEPDPAAGNERGGDREERRRGEVAGYREPTRLEPLGRLNRDPSSRAADRGYRAQLLGGQRGARG